MEIVLHSLKHSLLISVFVFVMMLVIDYLNVWTKGKFSIALKGKKWRQYSVASFLGVVPGCLGSFLNVSFYMRGIISFGAIVAGMVATSGDEAFVMLSLFPKQAFLLFGILFIIGIISGYIVDKLSLKLNLKTASCCQDAQLHEDEGCYCLTGKQIVEQIRELSLSRFLLLFILIFALVTTISGIVGPQQWGWERVSFLVVLLIALGIIITVPEHYLEEHIWNHIAKKHLSRVFLWTFSALLVVEFGLRFLNLEDIVQAHGIWVLIVAGFIGIIPESGPHLIFAIMFSKGLIPFSILLTSSIVQDGHGMLPLLSYSYKDALKVKFINLLIGLIIGSILFWAGV